MKRRNIAALIGLVVMSCGFGAVASAPTAFPLMPTVALDSDGTLYWNQRSFPLPVLESAEARKRYVELLNRALASQPSGADREAAARQAAQAAQSAARGTQNAGMNLGLGKQAALKIYSVDIEETEMGGVRVSVYTARDIPPRNRKRIVMEFESDGEAIVLAAVGKMKVVSVHYAGAYLKSNTDIAAVYRTLLKSYKPSQIAMFGISGGCQLAANTAAWLPTQNLPFPAALGLLSCAGGASPGDARNTMNGFDPQLSDFTPFGAGRRSRPAQAPVKAGDPEREILNVSMIPKGFPPSYLLTGTRDMCLSETALLHRKLRDAGVDADLNIFEGMWHAFNIEPDLPETKAALADLARFLDRHMAS